MESFTPGQHLLAAAPLTLLTTSRIIERNHTSAGLHLFAMRLREALAGLSLLERKKLALQ